MVDVFVLMLLAGAMSSLAKARRVNPYLAVILLLACCIGGAVGGIA